MPAGCPSTEEVLPSCRASTARLGRDVPAQLAWGTQQSVAQSCLPCTCPGNPLPGCSVPLPEPALLPSSPPQSSASSVLGPLHSARRGGRLFTPARRGCVGLCSSCSALLAPLPAGAAAFQLPLRKQDCGEKSNLSKAQ